MNRLGGLILALFSFGLGLTTLTQAQPTVRIWPLGDSITWGCCSGTQFDGGYRPELYNLLQSAGYTVDFVGTQADVNPAPGLPDHDHDGHGGWTIGEIDTEVGAWVNMIEDPDVILLDIGVNDFFQGIDTTRAVNRLQTLINDLASLRPNAKIIVANLLQVPSSATIDNEIQTQFNAYLPNVVSAAVAQGKQVSLVDLRSWCGPTDFSSDGVHPNATGYNLLGQAWFGAVTQVIDPSGTTNSPAIVRAEGQVDLQHVVVTFSKPVADSAATVGDFSLSGGLTVLQANLDSSKRAVTLTTTPQTPNLTYSVSVSGVRDRTPQQHLLAFPSTVYFLSAPAAEGANYVQVYAVDLPNQANYASTGVPYEVDNHRSIGGFSRIAYYLQLQPAGGSFQYVWVSMDAFTTDPGKIGIPTLASGAFFQQPLAHMNIRSSVPGLVTGDGINTGNIEFWWGPYDTSNAAGVPNASNTLYDWGDSASPTGPPVYGSMQIHNWSAQQTVFAYNGWNQTRYPFAGAFPFSDLGIGNFSGQNPDWTFAANANTYLKARLQVYVLPIPNVEVLTVATANPDSGVSVTVSPSDNNGAGSGTSESSFFYSAGAVVNVTAPGSAGTGTFQRWQLDGADYSTSPTTSVSMGASHELKAIYASAAEATAYVPEAANYSLAYSLIPPSEAQFQNTGVPYDVDNHATVGPFSRIGYFVELQNGSGLQWVWVSTEAFTSDPGKVGVPTQQSGALFQQTITNMNVRSSSGAGVTTGDGITTGNLEFWPYTSVYANSAHVSGASDWIYDWGDKWDSAYSVPYGCMQIHNWGAGQTLFAFNNWCLGNMFGADLGIGSSSITDNPNRDWTFAGNAGVYTYKKLQVYVLDRSTLTVNAANAGAPVIVRVAPSDLNGSGLGSTTFTRLYRNGTVVNLAAAVVVGSNSFFKWQRDGIDYSNNAKCSVTIDGNHTLTAVYSPTRTLTVTSVNPSSGVGIRIAPDDNHQGDGLTSLSRLYPDGMILNVAAASIANGNAFKKWQMDGVDLTTSPRVTITLHGDHTLSAVYGP